MHMPIFSNSHQHSLLAGADVPPFVDLLALKLFCFSTELRRRKRKSAFQWDDALKLLGNDAPELHYDEFDEPDPKVVEQAVVKKLKDLMAQDPAWPTQLLDNSQRLAASVGLNTTEQRVLAFVILLKAFRPLHIAAELVEIHGSRMLAECLSRLLNLPLAEVLQAFHQSSTLSKTGLLSLEHGTNQNLDEVLNFLNRHIVVELVETPMEAVDWLKGLVTPGTPSELTWSDLEHLQEPLQWLCQYLHKALAQQRQGVNVYIYGPSGTGKTQLARLLAQDLGLTLNELCTSDQDGDPIKPEQRVKTMGAVNTIMGSSQSLTLVDEVEEIFSGTTSMNWLSMVVGEKSHRHSNKAWINQVLETNRLPTLWISNSLQGMDPAFVRRFDVVLEMPVPPLGQRTRMIEQVAGALLNDHHKRQLAECEKLAPALVSRAANVVQCLGDDLDASQRSHAMLWLVGSTLKAQGHGEVVGTSRSLSGLYDPRFVNTRADLSLLAQQLGQVRSARICLYGLPGTGKTAFAHWLAQQLDMPLHIKRASDLLSMWVGGSEKNIAQAFEQAKADKAMLLIDEVDSFLQERTSARQSWEVTQVNEMLTQMEAFDGVFLASTNLMDRLDPAVLRRFDVKLNFQAMRPEQSVALLAQYCQTHGLILPDAQAQAAVKAIQPLTPGDFAAVDRAQRLMPLHSAEQWVRALQAEVQLKPRSSSGTMGFV